MADPPFLVSRVDGGRQWKGDVKLDLGDVQVHTVPEVPQLQWMYSAVSKVPPIGKWAS